MSKVKWFACQKFGHYAKQSPNKKKKKQQIAVSTEIDEYAARFEREFSLFVGGCRERAPSITSRDIEDQREHSMIVGHSSSVSTTSSTWYINSGASSNMTGVQDMFIEISETDLELEVVLGDDTVVRAVARRTVIFDRESMQPMFLRESCMSLG